MSSSLALKLAVNLKIGTQLAQALAEIAETSNGMYWNFKTKSREKLQKMGLVKVGMCDPEYGTRYILTAVGKTVFESVKGN